MKKYVEMAKPTLSICGRPTDVWTDKVIPVNRLFERVTQQSTSIFSEKISPANDGLFVVDGLFVHEGLYVYVQLTYKFQLFGARSRGMKKIASDKKIISERIRLAQWFIPFRAKLKYRLGLLYDKINQRDD